MRRTLSRTALAGLLGLALQAAHATDTATPPTARPKPAIVSRDDLPLWEIGIAAAGAGSPDYPGSGRTRARVLPLPYGIYRGKTLFEGDEISRNRFKFSRTVELDLSFSGALPADSNGSKERDGMPDLDLLLEIGPQLSVLLARPTRSTAFTLALPVRAVFSTDFDHLSIRGLLFAPELSYTNGKFASRGWSGRVTLGTSFATEQLADYFYQVAPRFVREDRPAYDASGGYLESSLTAVISRSFVNDISLFTFLRLASLSGSSNSRSPLLRDESNLSFGIGFAYTFLHSEKMVADD